MERPEIVRMTNTFKDLMRPFNSQISLVSKYDAHMRSLICAYCKKICDAEKVLVVSVEADERLLSGDVFEGY